MFFLISIIEGAMLVFFYALFPSSAAVAQVTVNHLVAGSNPASGVF